MAELVLFFRSTRGKLLLHERWSDAERWRAKRGGGGGVEGLFNFFFAGARVML